MLERPYLTCSDVFFNRSTFKSAFKMLLCQWDKRRAYELSNSDNTAASITDLKKNPMGTVAEGEGTLLRSWTETNRRSIAFHQTLRLLSGTRWRCWVKRCCWWRMKNPEIVKVNLDDLWTGFCRRALKEWQKLGHTIREQFKRNWQNGWKIHAYPQPGYMVMWSL